MESVSPPADCCTSVTRVCSHRACLERFILTLEHYYCSWFILAGMKCASTLQSNRPENEGAVAVQRDILHGFFFFPSHFCEAGANGAS